jgi:two-component system cell cycle sensor histidine kinase/response regulator CckA
MEEPSLQAVGSLAEQRYTPLHQVDFMPTSKETILVIDDEPEVVSLIEDTLRGVGYRVLATGDPHAALRIARTHAEPVHLLLTDVVMPIMGGAALSDEFRILRPGAKVLFMSAYEVETVEAYRVRLAPGEPILHKPFTLADLERTVQAALRYRVPVSWPRTSRRQ